MQAFSPRVLFYRLAAPAVASRWLFAIVASIPVAWLIVCHFFAAPADSHATGFIQYDQAYYMAEARAQFDHGFHFLFGLPSSMNPNTPRVYFHPQTLLLGTLLYLTGLPPGWIFVAFGLVSNIIFFRLAIALYEASVGLRSPAQFLVLPLFLWGGGITLLAGLLLKSTTGVPIDSLDTGGWGPNLLRGVIYGTEAYYHVLFFGAVLAALQRWYALSLVLVALVCLSHPVTGVELPPILIGWFLLENFLDRGAAPPFWFGGGAALLLLLHLGYWLFLLPWVSPEHAALAPTWNVPWVLHWYNELPEYGVVGSAALWRLRDRSHIASAIADRQFRLFFAWFIAAFLLANHDLFISSRQPLHFTRGYVWTPLFLVGAPVFLKIVERLLEMARRNGRAPLIGFCGLMLLDNAWWFGAAGSDILVNGRYATLLSRPMYVTRSQGQVLQRLNGKAFTGGLVVSNSRPLSYEVIVFTPLRAWYSDRWNTPFRERRLEELDSLFQRGRDLRVWQDRKMVAVVQWRKDPEAPKKLLALGYHIAYRNNAYDVLVRQPYALDSHVTADTP